MCGIARQVEHARIVADTAKAQDTDFLDADFRCTWSGSLVRVVICVDSAVVVDLVPSTGTAISLNAGGPLSAGGLHSFEVALDQGRTWNLQTADASGCIVLFLVVTELAVGN